jgi:hypothetical protein
MGTSFSVVALKRGTAQERISLFALSAIRSLN